MGFSVPTIIMHKIFVWEVLVWGVLCSHNHYARLHNKIFVWEVLVSLVGSRLRACGSARRARAFNNPNKKTPRVLLVFMVFRVTNPECFTIMLCTIKRKQLIHIGQHDVGGDGNVIDQSDP